MSTVFHFGPGETENGQRFGSDSKAGSVASIRKFVHESSIRRPACLPNSAAQAIGIEAKGFARRLKLSCCRARCLQRKKRSAGTADATGDPEPANFAAARKFRVE